MFARFINYVYVQIRGCILLDMYYSKDHQARRPVDKTFYLQATRQEICFVFDGELNEISIYFLNISPLLSLNKNVQTYNFGPRQSDLYNMQDQGLSD